MPGLRVSVGKGQGYGVGVNGRGWGPATAQRVGSGERAGVRRVGGSISVLSVGTGCQAGFLPGSRTYFMVSASALPVTRSP